jgi:hypothetical protein
MVLWQPWMRWWSSGRGCGAALDATCDRCGWSMRGATIVKAYGFQKVIAETDCQMIQRVWNSEIRRDEWESMYSVRV